MQVGNYEQQAVEYEKQLQYCFDYYCYIATYGERWNSLTPLLVARRKHVYTKLSKWVNLVENLHIKINVMFSVIVFLQVS